MLTIRPYGPAAVLIGFAERADEAAWNHGRRLIAALERRRPSGLREVVPAFTTILLDWEPAGGGHNSVERDAWTRDFVGDWSRPDHAFSRDVAGALPVSDRVHEIAVHYDGPDLSRVAEHARLEPEDVVRRHVTPVYRVHCLGFAPGFPYLGGLDPRLHTPRLATPRLRVPAGSVAIGGEHTGIYSIASPGGWNLIGRTDARLFDAHAKDVEAMFRLRPGDRVRFVRTQFPEPEPGDGPAEVPGSGRRVPGFLRVLAPGVGITLQDRGRPGFARFGVPPGGAMDPHSAAWANRLLDNPPGAAVLELCLQGQRFEVLRDGWLAVTGASSPRGRPRNHSFRVRAGELLEFGPAASGVWSYLAMPDGFEGALVLGSRSANPRAGIGRALAAGDEPGAAHEHQLVVPSAVAGRVVPWDEAPEFRPLPTLRVWRAPQWDLFPEADRAQFFSVAWTITSQCDRVGYRLSGPTFATRVEQIVSEPVLPGSIQVPAGGQPIITMPDGPTLGGYPKLGLVDPADLPRLAQCQPGQPVRFQLAT